MNYKNILTSDYWFNIDTIGLHLVDKVVLGIGVGFVVVGIVLALINRRTKNPFDKALLGKFTSALLATGFVEMIWFVFRYENAVYLGTLFVAGLIGLAFLVRLVFLVKDLFKNRKAALETWQKEQIKLKYLTKQR